MGQPDVSLGGGGGLVIGNTAGGNIGMDGNEIMARNNGQTSTLFLNNDGGSVVTGSNLVVNGTLDIGYQIVTAEHQDQGAITANCPSGKKVLGGGCRVEIGDSLWINAPVTNGAGWSCAADASTHIRSYAICARVQ
jgi:hypothetical protein